MSFQSPDLPLDQIQRYSICISDTVEPNGQTHAGALGLIQSDAAEPKAIDIFPHRMKLSGNRSIQEFLLEFLCYISHNEITHDLPSSAETFGFVTAVVNRGALVSTKDVPGNNTILVLRKLRQEALVIFPGNRSIHLTPAIYTAAANSVIRRRNGSVTPDPDCPLFQIHVAFLGARLRRQPAMDWRVFQGESLHVGRTIGRLLEGCPPGKAGDDKSMDAFRKHLDAFLMRGCVTIPDYLNPRGLSLTDGTKEHVGSLDAGIVAFGEALADLSAPIDHLSLMNISCFGIAPNPPLSAHQSLSLNSYTTKIREAAIRHLPDTLLKPAKRRAKRALEAKDGRNTPK